MPKILLIAYYWPPSGGGGVLRWLKFTRYLPELGIDTTVYTPENGVFPGYDAELINEVNSNITVVKFPIWEPHRLF
ncbi:MAG: hypothetical protein IPN29_13805 [Saprospiraceae bacterium]|nr:hypothetical protein [Saprospiraceae bacterium]